MAQSPEVAISLTRMGQNPTVTLLTSNGTRYEDVYGTYMEIFRELATYEGQWVARDVPGSWLPLFTMLNIVVERVAFKFEHDQLVAAAWNAANNGTQLDRTALEALCAFRPETIDALWKLDRQWTLHEDRIHFTRKEEHFKREFIVTGNGSFDRPEVVAYEKALAAYTPTKKRVIMVPCAADKPYPSHLHAKVIELLEELGVRDQWYIANATGVLGIVPEDLWPVMPYYDSGIPNQYRLMRIAKDYFSRTEHEAIVTYMDFYTRSFDQGVSFSDYRGGMIHVNEPRFYYDYLDLLDNVRLSKLRQAIINYSAAASE